MLYEKYVTAAFRKAGIEVDGPHPWDLKVLDRRFFRSVALNSSLGLGDTYVDGWWDCTDLAAFFKRLLPTRSRIQRIAGLSGSLLRFRRMLFNLQGMERAKEVVNAHYDLPTELFTQMLGHSMVYSCGYWKESRNLDDAQYAKLDLICRKLDLGPDDRVLDLGCGFGTFSRYAAEYYGCTVVGVTLSGAQARYARALCDGLPIEIHENDYRDFQAYAGNHLFSKIVSIGMFEAIGHKSFSEFMQVVDLLLEDGGSWLLHTVGDTECSSDPWLAKHIFPNGELPTHRQIEQAASGRFNILDTHEFDNDYALTLAAWQKNFIDKWEEICRSSPQSFDYRFFRKWIYYLSCCRGAFLARDIFLWQIVMSRDEVNVGYQPIR